MVKDYEPIKCIMDSLELYNSYLIVYSGSTNELSMITVLSKLDKSIFLKFGDGTKKWMPSGLTIWLYDHVPVEFLRKEKLLSLEND